MMQVSTTVFPYLALVFDSPKDHKAMIKRYQELMKHHSSNLGSHMSSSDNSIAELNYCRERLMSLFNQPLKQSERVYLKWDQLNYFVPVPLSIKDKMLQKIGHSEGSLSSFDEIDINGLQKERDENLINGFGMKQILNNSSGYVKPGECVAILGPSGSGKTSLLNVLSGRINLSKGSTFLGKITCNGKPLIREDFGKSAAFVQQDDIMF